MEYHYTELKTEKTNTKTNYIAASEILRANGLTPYKYCTKKYRYMQPTVYIFNADGEKIGFIQENVNKDKAALLTTYKKMELN